MIHPDRMVTWKQIAGLGVCMIASISTKMWLVIAGAYNPEWYQMAVAVDALECLWILAYVWVAFYHVTDVFEDSHLALILRIVWGIYIFQAIAIFPGVIARLGGWDLLQSGPL